MLLGLAAVGAAQGAARYWVGTGNWSQPANWAATSGGTGGAGVPSGSDDVFFDGNGTGSATVDTGAGFGGSVASVTVSSGYAATVTQNRDLSVGANFALRAGTWRFTAGTPAALSVGNDMVVSNATIFCERVSTSGEGVGRVFTVLGNLTVHLNGAFNAEGLGFDGGAGPGRGGGFAEPGASHGGRGAHYLYGSALLESRMTYGAPTRPISLGSGGANQSPPQRSRGGGAIKLVVGGTFDLRGTVNADAETYSWNAGGGAGGSVWIAADAIQGDGIVSARGKAHTHQSTASGGGGRIAVYSGNGFGALRLRAYDGGNAIRGGAGTIYLQGPADVDGKGTLIVDNNGMTSLPGCVTVIPAGQTWAFSTLVLTNAGFLGVVGNTYAITNVSLRIDPRSSVGFHLDNATLSCGKTFAYSNYVVTLYRSCNLTATNVTVGNNAVLRIDGANTLTGAVTIVAGGRMDHSYYAINNTEQPPTVKRYGIDLTLDGDLIVAQQGSIDVKGRGFASSKGPGAGGGYAGAGASHGGRGANYGTTAISKPTYGSLKSPTDWGSGATVDQGGSQGGGAVKLKVTGTLTLHGTIDASARDCTHNGGQGSGGSIWIDAGDFEGTGTIRATGAARNGSGDQAGGGGRIALYSAGDFGSLAAVNASGRVGNYGANNSAAGTVFLQSPACPEGRLIVDNQSVLTSQPDITTQIPAANFTGTPATLTVGNVELRNRGHLYIPALSTLAVYGNWTNAAAFTAGTDSVVAFVGNAPGRIYGSTTFAHLTATNAPGRVLYFGAGTTTTVADTLALNRVMLRSTADGQPWFLTLAKPGGIQSIGAVTVRDSNASGGQTLYAGAGSDSLGNNVNWVFPAKGTAILIR
jgi:hypothetical protein